jgi:hypothetical protein
MVKPKNTTSMPTIGFYRSLLSLMGVYARLLGLSKKKEIVFLFF